VGAFFAASLQGWAAISGLGWVPVVICPANIEGARRKKTPWNCCVDHRCPQLQNQIAPTPKYETMQGAAGVPPYRNGSGLIAPWPKPDSAMQGGVSVLLRSSVWLSFGDTRGHITPRGCVGLRRRPACPQPNSNHPHPFTKSVEIMNESYRFW
jgi:hypothetical protein